MEYNSKSLTRSGAALFANADTNKQPLIVDKVVVSGKVIPAGTDISTLTLDDFTNAQQFDANNVTQNDNTFTVTSVLSNENLKTDLSLALIGILAHLGTDTSTQTIIGVAIGNDPFVLPAYNGTPFRLVPSITMGFSASQNVTLQVNDDVYITQKDMQTLMKSQGFLTKADIDAFGYATEKYVDAATTVKADDSKVVHNSGAEEIAGQKKFDNPPILKSNGKPFITEDELNAGIQKAIDQANTDMLAELTKRGYPSLVWKGTQAEFDALPTKDPNGEYQIVEDNS